MKHETMKGWRDALAKIATAQLPNCEIKTDEFHDNRVEIYLPEQDEKRWPMVSVEIEAAGKIKRDRIRIFKNYRPIRDYETDEQYARNIAKVVAEVRSDYAKAKEEERIRAEQEKADKERKETLETIALAAVKAAFSNHKVERFNAEGNHRGGKAYLDFPKIKDADGFAWCRRLELEYKANDANELTWAIGDNMRIIIPDLAAFSETIY
ncbi:MAG: hypothetical protein PHE89_04015 [Alphaproteobacteria bacterium]|nr:hypothetical protein [Alphaproteobacteria bacterium]